MRFILSAALAVFLPAAGMAQESWSTYDPQSGNSYNNYSDDYGTTTNGYNAITGSQWQLRQNNDGTYSGRDADGNYFTGNNNTGYYNNLGTGETCIGTGYARSCY